MIAKILKQKGIIATLVGIATIGAVIFWYGDDGTDAKAIPIYRPSVNIIRIGDDISRNSVNATGEITAFEKITVRAELSERVEWIAADIGDAVEPGKIVVLFNNDSVLTQRKQLQAALDTEKALLDQLRTGTRPEQLAILESQVASAQVGVRTAQSSLQNAIREAYTRADDLLYNTMDSFFYDADTLQPRFIYVTNNSQLERILENDLIKLGQILSKWEKIVDSTDGADGDELTQLSSTVNTDLMFMREYLGNLAVLINNLTPSSETSGAEIATLRSQVSGMRNVVNTAITSLSQTSDGVSTAQSALSVAKDQLVLAEAGSTNEQIRIQQYRVDAAESALDSNSITLKKTTAVSPIWGTISEMKIDIGDVVSPGQYLFTVINRDTLGVRVFLSVEEASRVQRGNIVNLEGGGTGRVERIAPAINSETGKVEVYVKMDSEQKTKYIDGQFVSLAVLASKEQGDILIPLTSIANLGDQSFVYTVTEAGTAAATPVTLGEIQGAYIQLTDINPDVKMIIEDSRDLDDGTAVSVQ